MAGIHLKLAHMYNEGSQLIEIEIVSKEKNSATIDLLLAQTKRNHFSTPWKHFRWQWTLLRVT